MNELVLSFGGIRFGLRSTVPLRPLSPAYGHFIDRADRPPHATYEILPPSAELHCARPACDCRTVWECPTWRLTHCHDGFFCVHLRTVPDEKLVMVARVASDFSHGMLLSRSGRQAAPAPHALNYPCDQVLIVNRLALANAGILHSCGIGIDGKAWLFSGPSGAGKTTLARLWRAGGARLLNDDRMLVRKTTEGFIASATPWHGDEKAIDPEPMHLGGIVFIEHGTENRVVPLQPSQALARLMANAVAPFYLKSAVQNLAELWSGVVETVPTCSLSFTPDQRALEVVRRWMP